MEFTLVIAEINFFLSFLYLLKIFLTLLFLKKKIISFFEKKNIYLFFSSQLPQVVPFPTTNFTPLYTTIFNLLKISLKIAKLQTVIFKILEKSW